MKIALIGATGFVGSQVLSEAVSRGHRVTAIARTADKMQPSDHVSPARVDMKDEGALVNTLRGHDAVINASKFMQTDARALIRSITAAGVRRWLVVGGAGSLEVAPGVALVDTPEFPQAYHAEASAGRAFLESLKRDAPAELEWTFLSPSAMLLPGECTGKFRLGDDRLLVDENGESSISVGDYAVALVDELEQPRHLRRRFTVGY